MMRIVKWKALWFCWAVPSLVAVARSWHHTRDSQRLDSGSPRGHPRAGCLHAGTVNTHSQAKVSRADLNSGQIHYEDQLRELLRELWVAHLDVLTCQIKSVIFKPEHSFALSVQTDPFCAIPGPWGQPGVILLVITNCPARKCLLSQLVKWTCAMNLCFAFLSGFVTERSGCSSSGRARVHGLAPGCSPWALLHPADPAARWGGENPAARALSKTLPDLNWDLGL